MCQRTLTTSVLIPVDEKRAMGRVGAPHHARRMQASCSFAFVPIHYTLALRLAEIRYRQLPSVLLAVLARYLSYCTFITPSTQPQAIVAIAPPPCDRHIRRIRITPILQQSYTGSEVLHNQKEHPFIQSVENGSKYKTKQHQRLTLVGLERTV